MMIMATTIPKSVHRPWLFWMPYICSTTYVPDRLGPIGTPFKRKFSKESPGKSFLNNPCNNQDGFCLLDIVSTIIITLFKCLRGIQSRPLLNSVLGTFWHHLGLNTLNRWGRKLVFKNLEKEFEIVCIYLNGVSVECNVWYRVSPHRLWQIYNQSKVARHQHIDSLLTCSRSGVFSYDEHLQSQVPSSKLSLFGANKLCSWILDVQHCIWPMNRLPNLGDFIWT